MPQSSISVVAKPWWSSAAVVKLSLLDLVACPVDGHPLRLVAGEHERDAAVDEGELSCDDGHRYRISGGVPRMTPVSEDGPGADQGGTFDSFSAKWSKVSPEELRQRFAQQFAWYLERYGWRDEQQLADYLGERGPILDAGTGLGGDAARFARITDAEVVGLDLSNGIEMAHDEFGARANLHYVQGDILRPPFRRGGFGYISSDQVIHHTPDAPRAFSTLAGLLRPGGSLAVYVYRRKAPLRELADDFIRSRTTAMSVEECLEFSEGVSELGRELSRVGATISLERGVPLLGIEAGEHDVQRLVYWHFMKCFWNDDFSPNLNDLVNFDWYHPPHASRHTAEEVTAWCDEAGLEVEHVDVSESGISVRACAPLDET